MSDFKEKISIIFESEGIDQKDGPCANPECSSHYSNPARVYKNKDGSLPLCKVCDYQKRKAESNKNRPHRGI